jgi:plasmid stability protein
MASLTLRNVPPELIQSLRAAAAHDRRSLSQEVVHLLDLAVRARNEGGGRAAQDVEAQLTTRRKLAGQWESDLDPDTEADPRMAARGAR